MLNMKQETWPYGLIVRVESYLGETCLLPYKLLTPREKFSLMHERDISVLAKYLTHGMHDISWVTIGKGFVFRYVEINGMNVTEFESIKLSPKVEVIYQDPTMIVV
jgi:hypothetical protein